MCTFGKDCSFVWFDWEGFDFCGWPVTIPSVLPCSFVRQHGDVWKDDVADLVPALWSDCILVRSRSGTDGRKSGWLWVSFRFARECGGLSCCSCRFQVDPCRLLRVALVHPPWLYENQRKTTGYPPRNISLPRRGPRWSRYQNGRCQPILRRLWAHIASQNTTKTVPCRLCFPFAVLMSTMMPSNLSPSALAFSRI